MWVRLFFFIAILYAAVGSADAQLKYDFICDSLNRIEMNGADWSKLRLLAHDLRMRDSIPDSVSLKMHIMHIGDSHIQAGHFSEALRSAVQLHYGNGGRGCIAPLRLASTNQPTDYSISSPQRVAQKGRITSRNRSRLEIGVTGIATKFSQRKVTLEIGVKHADDRFSSISVLHAAGSGYSEATINGEILQASCPSKFLSNFSLNTAEEHITLRGIDASSEFWGVFLSNSNNGAIVSSIGNNSACYSHYNQISNFAEQMACLSPQLVIISLGTNEAFGRFSKQEISSQIHTLVSKLQRAMPQVHILLTTPMECDRLRRTGRRRRRRVSFSTNDNCRLVRNVIIKYGKEHNVPVWDLYTVAGGNGSAAKWVQNGLLSSRDHVHCSTRGYTLQGELLSQALIHALNEE